jgi:hypothetical protein
MAGDRRRMGENQRGCNWKDWDEFSSRSFHVFSQTHLSSTYPDAHMKIQNKITLSHQASH